MPHLSFHLGPLEITGFGVMVALGALAGLWVFQNELAARFLAKQAVDVGMAAVTGGLIGAKLLYVMEHIGQEPIAAGLVSRGGMSWFGGVIGGALFALAVATALRLPLLPLVAAATPALALGQAFGRIGCFLVGDDYGRPSNLPWAVAFPEGLPPTIDRVHPTQLYEALFLALLGCPLALAENPRARPDHRRPLLPARRGIPIPAGVHPAQRPGRARPHRRPVAVAPSRCCGVRPCLVGALGSERANTVESHDGRVVTHVEFRYSIAASLVSVIATSSSAAAFTP